MTNETNTSTSTEANKTDAQKAAEKREEMRKILQSAAETLAKRVRTRYVLGGGSQADAAAYVTGYVQSALIGLILDRPATKQAAAVQELQDAASALTDEIAAIIESQSE